MFWLMVSQLSDGFVSIFVSTIMGLLVCDDSLRRQINLVLFCTNGVHEVRKCEVLKESENSRKKPSLLLVTNSPPRDLTTSACGSIFKLSRVKNDCDGWHVELYIPAHCIISLRDMMADFVTIVLNAKCSKS